MSVIAHPPFTDGEELLILAQHVAIEHDFFDGFQVPLLATDDGILFALFGARVVPISAIPPRHITIGLLDAREIFVV